MIQGQFELPLLFQVTAVFMLANDMGVDLDEAVKKKITKIKNKYNFF